MSTVSYCGLYKCLQLAIAVSINVCRPETQIYVKKLEMEKKKKAQGEGEDNRSFFAKYVSLRSGVFL